jgi:mannosyl-glycoprotein endo-beta-N-acetylglucosaminidase
LIDTYKGEKMKKLILPAACFAVLSTPAFEKVVHAAENDTPVTEVGQIHAVTKYVKVDSGSNLNLRASSSSSAEVLAKLANGSKVTVHSEGSGWAKVIANGKEGYVSTEYLTASALSESSTPSKAAPVSVAKSTITTKYVKVAVGSNLNLRSSASTTGSVLVKLANDTKVTVYSESNGWARIEAGGKEGYVSVKYLSASKSSAPSKSKTENTPIMVSAPKQETTIKYVNVKLKTSLNMRNKPSTNASIIIKLAKGIEVKVISENKGWSLVRVYGKEGYVSSEYLSTVKPGSNLGTGSQDPKDNRTNDPSAPAVKEEDTSNIPIPAVEQGDTPNTPTPVVELDNTDLIGEEQQGTEPQKQETTLKYVNIHSGSNLNMRSEPSTNGAIMTKLASGTAVTVYSEENGWAKVNANGKTGFVSKQYLITKVDQLEPLNQKMNLIYSEYDTTLDELTKIQMKANPQTDTKYTTYLREDALLINDKANPKTGVVHGSGWNVRGGVGTNYWAVGKVNDGETLQLKSKIKGADGYDWYEIDYNRSWVNASPEDVKSNLDPNNSIKNPLTSFQFLKLSETTSLDQFEVNERILSGKGVLQGHAATFITAGEKYGVNDVYLISHALLETGNGKSQLAQGVELYGKTVYNMFGIGAYDGTALASGAKFAYNAGWFSPEAAILGGAKFIAQGYISSGQDTIYKMRWNPQGAATTGVATHQYATDIGWAAKQVKQIYNIYSLLDSYKVTLEIPSYKK